MDNGAAKSTLALAGALGAIAVGLGAFGAHGLKKWAETLPDGAARLAWWQTGSDYLFYTLPLLVGWALLQSKAPTGLARVGVILAVAGAALFAGSLMVMTLTGAKFLGMVTPLGGLGLMASWGCLALAAWRHRGA